MLCKCSTGKSLVGTEVHYLRAEAVGEAPNLSDLHRYNVGRLKDVIISYDEIADSCNEQNKTG